MRDVLDDYLETMMDEIQFTFPVPFREGIRRNIIRFAYDTLNKPSMQTYVKDKMNEINDDECNEDFCDEHCDKTDCPAHVNNRR